MQILITSRNVVDAFTYFKLFDEMFRKTLHEENDKTLMSKEKYSYAYEKDSCNKCAHCSFLNFHCFSNDRNEPKAVTSATTNLLCFSCKTY